MEKCQTCYLSVYAYVIFICNKKITRQQDVIIINTYKLLNVNNLVIIDLFTNEMHINQSLEMNLGEKNTDFGRFM